MRVAGVLYGDCFFFFKPLRSGTADQKVNEIIGCLRDSSYGISGPQVCGF